MKNSIFAKKAQAFIALSAALALTACGDSSTSSTVVSQDTSNSVNSSSFLQATGNTVIEIPRASAECQSPLAVELMNTDVHSDEPALEAHRDLLMKCSAERSAID